MDKHLEVREFDSIICNSDYETDSKYKYLNKKQFEKLETFIREFSGNDNNTDALNFMRVGYKRNIGDTITIKNYVGLIQMEDGFQIQVLPKITFDNGDDGNTETKRIFIKMLRSMKDFPIKAFNVSSLKIDKMNLYEIFINMYIQEVRRLVKRGIKSSYVNQEDNLHYFKGKLNVSQNIRTNIAHKERFYVSFDEFQQNRPENRLIKATLKKLQALTTNAENSKSIMQLLNVFELVDVSTNYQTDFSKVLIDRSTKDYGLLMQWSKIFLMNKSFTTFSGTATSRALLFPMESLYESYVAQQMKKMFIPDGWSVSTQDKGHYLFTQPIEKFALRPDIVLEKNSRIIIMDTKWKSLTNNERANYGISQSDMYQMYAYSKKYKTSEVWLLYPLNDVMKNSEIIKFHSGDGVTVNLFFVDVANIEDSLLELKKQLNICIPNE